jgi:hypothetical protein
MINVKTQIEVEGIVADSARLLDVEHPGWEDRVDVGPMFSIHNAENCMLTQLAGQYGDEIARLGEKYGDGVYSETLGGFACTEHEEPLYIRAWRYEVEKRKDRVRTDFLTDRVTEDDQISVSEIPVITTVAVPAPVPA